MKSENERDRRRVEEHVEKEREGKGEIDRTVRQTSKRSHESK